MKLTSLQPSEHSAHPTYHNSTLDLSSLDKSTTLHFTHRVVDPNHLDIDFIIGTTTGNFTHRPILLFFTKSSWICSIDIDGTEPQEEFTQPFFCAIKLAEWDGELDRESNEKEGCPLRAAR